MKKEGKLIIITGDLTYRSAYSLFPAFNNIIDLNSFHPLQFKECLLDILESIKNGSEILLIINSDVAISILNNILITDSKNYPLNIIKLYEINKFEMKEISFGKLGYEIEWMNGFLNNLFEETLEIQEKISE
ncbi:hypothetical protein Goe21_01230 [Bacillus phage vB_BsuM-Goe21]|nr:hypothetical protein Goe21_01230 [Bacillus phage vB_BsuM-Goe21]